MSKVVVDLYVFKAPHIAHVVIGGLEFHWKNEDHWTVLVNCVAALKIRKSVPTCRPDHLSFQSKDNRNSSADRKASK